MSLHVFVNGVKCDLLEDRRLALFNYFPPNTLLFDPYFDPPRKLEISQLSDEYGVTVLKLLPNASYFARYERGDQLVPALPWTSQEEGRCLILHNVPLECTPKDIGVFFEEISLVREADLIRQNGIPRGRAYVHLQNLEATEQLIEQKQVFFPLYQTWLFVEGADSAVIKRIKSAASVPNGMLPSYRDHININPPPSATASRPPYEEPVDGGPVYIIAHMREEDLPSSLNKQQLNLSAKVAREIAERQKVVFVVVSPAQQILGIAALRKFPRKSTGGNADVSWLSSEGYKIQTHEFVAHGEVLFNLPEGTVVPPDVATAVLHRLTPPNPPKTRGGRPAAVHPARAPAYPQRFVKPMGYHADY